MIIKNQNLVKISSLLIVLGAIYWGFKTFYSEPVNIDKEKVKVAISNGKSFLKNIQKQNGAISDTINPLFNIWETVLAAKALYSIDKDTNDIAFSKAMKFLEENENEHGLVCHNLKCREGYCIETSSLYLQLLTDLKGKEHTKKQVEHIANLQQKSGEWLIGNPDVKENPDFPSSTAFALNLLQKSDIQALYAKEAVKWVISKQNQEGHWGSVWEYYDLPAYALAPMAQVIMHINTPEILEVRKKAIAYILSKQNEDGSWSYKVSAFSKRPSKELETALMLSAIQSFQNEKSEANEALEKASLKAVNFLISSQSKNGSWDGGFFPIQSPNYEKKEYIFATSMTISTLQSFLNHYKK